MISGRAAVRSEAVSISVAGHGHFHALGQSLGCLPRGKRPEGVRVDEHGAGLVERAHRVLHAVQVDGGLAAHRGIHLRQQGGGDVVKINAAHVGGGGKARQIAHHAAAHGGHAVAAIHV